MEIKDCEALLRVLQTFLSMPPHSADDMADLFDLLGRLSQAEKQTFWTWLGNTAPNIRRWLIAKGSGSRRAA
jgi:hypothetical protein